MYIPSIYFTSDFQQMLCCASHSINIFCFSLIFILIHLLLFINQQKNQLWLSNLNYPPLLLIRPIIAFSLSMSPPYHGHPLSSRQSSPSLQLKTYLTSNVSQFWWRMIGLKCSQFFSPLICRVFQVFSVYNPPKQLSATDRHILTETQERPPWSSLK